MILVIDKAKLVKVYWYWFSGIEFNAIKLNSGDIYVNVKQLADNLELEFSEVFDEEQRLLFNNVEYVNFPNPREWYYVES